MSTADPLRPRDRGGARQVQGLAHRRRGRGRAGPRPAPAAARRAGRRAPHRRRRRGLPGDGPRARLPAGPLRGARPHRRAGRGRRYALAADDALVEMAAAAGLGRLPGGLPDDRTARTASTYGVGELIRDALDRGARRIVLAVGGSATTDGGAGMAAALGARFETSSGPARAQGGAGLLAVDRLDLDGLDRRLADASVVVACDVDNPLTGPSGAAAVYGPQKGATAADRRAARPGAGPLGGPGRRRHRPRPAPTCRERAPPAASGSGRRRCWAPRCGRASTCCSTSVASPRTVAGADLVIVGEGSLDEQSLRGKGPIGVAAAAARAGRPRRRRRRPQHRRAGGLRAPSASTPSTR